MMLSPQHRVLLQGWQTELLLGTGEGLAAISHLLNDFSITRATHVDAVTYIHFMFDRHEVVRADGLWVESFLPGPVTVGGLEDAARTELLALFPELAEGEVPSMQAARPLLKRWEAALFA
jgi:hypothetical protein